MISKKIKFSMLQVAFWCMYVSSYSFILAYFLNSGISITYAGFAMSAATFSGFVGQFVISAICDKLQRSKIVYASGIIYLLFIIFIIVQGEKTPIFAIVTMMLFGFVQMPMLSVLDAWIMKSFDNAACYAPIRAWGSIGFALFALVFGKIISEIGYNSIFIFSAVFVTINTIIVLTLPDAKRAHTSVRIKDVNISIFKNKKFVLFLALMFCYGISVQPVIQMIAVIILEVGGSVEHQGIVLFLSGFVQMPVLLITPKFAHISPQKRLFVSMICEIVCLLLLMFATNYVHVIIAKAIDGIAFAIAVSSLRETSMSMCPTSMKTTAVSLVDAFQVSLAGGIGTALSGLIIENVSLQFFIIIEFIILSFATICFAVNYVDFNFKNILIKKQI